MQPPPSPYRTTAGSQPLPFLFCSAALASVVFVGVRQSRVRHFRSPLGRAGTQQSAPLLACGSLPEFWRALSRFCSTFCHPRQWFEGPCQQFTVGPHDHAKPVTIVTAPDRHPLFTGENHEAEQRRVAPSEIFLVSLPNPESRLKEPEAGLRPYSLLANACQSSVVRIPYCVQRRPMVLTSCRVFGVQPTY